MFVTGGGQQGVGNCRTKVAFIILVTTQNNDRTLSTLNAFSADCNWNGDSLLTEKICKKAKAAPMSVISVNYGSLTETVRFIAMQGSAAPAIRRCLDRAQG